MSIATMRSRIGVGAGLLLIGLEVGPAAGRAYTRAGQYVRLETERGNGYFVLAGDVGAATWELVVRNAGGAADALTHAPLGTTFAISVPPLGAGFPVEHAVHRRMVIAVAGSALAVARPIMRRRIADGDAEATELYVGVRSTRELALAEELRLWAQHGAAVVLCVSRTGDEDTNHLPFEGARLVAGYVQHELARALRDGQIARGALVVAAGPERMLDDIRDLGTGSGGGIDVVTNV